MKRGTGNLVCWILLAIAIAAGCARVPKPVAQPPVLPGPEPAPLPVTKPAAVPTTTSQPVAPPTTATTTESATEPAATMPTTESTTAPLTLPATTQAVPSTVPVLPTTRPSTTQASRMPLPPAGTAEGAVPSEPPFDFIARDDRADRAPHPEFLPADSSLPRLMGWVIAGLTGAAAVLGPVSRALRVG